MNLRSFGLPKIPTTNRFFKCVLPALSAMILVGGCLTAPTTLAESAPEQAILTLDQAVQLTLKQPRNWVLSCISVKDIKG